MMADLRLPARRAFSSASSRNASIAIEAFEPYDLRVLLAGWLSRSETRSCRLRSRVAPYTNRHQALRS